MSLKIEKIIYSNLLKYNKTLEKLYQNKIRNLMFHKKSHFTAIFTEYLIWDDNQEFLFELYPKKFILSNLSSYIKIQHHKFFIPVLINDWGRNLIKLNTKMKKLLISQIADKSKKIDPSKYILKKYSKILPSDLSDNTIEDKENLIDNSLKTFKDLNIQNNNNQNMIKNQNKNVPNKNIPLKSKEISESESTIDNVNANNDISISLDLKINQKYDEKILNQNAGFVIGKNGKNDEELLRMMKYMKPINTAYIYQNNKKKLRTNYIYLDYINNKTYRLTEITKKSSKNKSEKKKKFINNIKNENLKTLANLNDSNKNIVHKNINCQNYNSKNTSINKKYGEQKSSNNKKNFKLYTKSNNNVKSNNNNNLNNNLINGYNDQNNKTISTKTNSNSNNTMYKNKSENRKPTINNNRNKKNENVLTTQHNSEVKVITPFPNEPKILKENSNKEIITNIRYGSFKFGNDKKKGNSQESSKIQTIMMPQKLISNSKERNYQVLKTTNNINNVNNINIYGGDIKSFKRNNNKILDISSDAKKMKFFISTKDENNYKNKLSGRKINKKEKSLDNKILNNGLNKPIIGQKNKKNIIIVKRKISESINTFNQI